MDRRTFSTCTWALLAFACTDAHAQALEIDLPANAIAYSSQTKMLYATIASSGGPEYAGALIEIDPIDATVTNGVHVGTNPGPLAISPDAALAYVGLNGASAVRPVDLTLLAAGTQFPTLDHVQEIAVMPGSPATVALTMGSSGDGTVAVYDSGILRGTISGFVPFANTIAFDDQTGVLFGYNNYSTAFTLSRYGLGPDGVSLSQIEPDVIRGFGATIALVNGVIYASTGAAVDGSKLQLIGTYQSSGPVVVDDSIHSVIFAHGVALEVFDRDTFVPTFSMRIPAAQGNPVDAAGCGSGCVAVAFDSGRIFVVPKVSENVFADGFD